MPPPNSNAVATVTIQDIDLLSSVEQTLVQAAQASVTFQVANALLYSGYYTVTSPSIGVVLLPPGSFSPFVYIRNANPSGNNNPLVVETRPQGGGTIVAQNLFPGGIFLFANTSIATSSPFSCMDTVQVLVVAGEPVTMEYCIAF